MDGIHCMTAASGETALKMLAEKPSIGLVITDLRMGNVDGLDLIRQVRESVRAAMPIIIVSGDADVKDAIAAMHLAWWISAQSSRLIRPSCWAWSNTNWALSPDFLQIKRSQPSTTLADTCRAPRLRSLIFAFQRKSPDLSTRAFSHPLSLQAVGSWPNSRRRRCRTGSV